MEFLLIFVVMVLLLLFKGFFSGSEIALVNSDKLKLHHKANQGHRGAKLVLRLFQTPDVVLGTTLVGTNISTIALTTIGTMLMIRYFGAAGDLYAVLLFTPLFLILGEVVPKSVYQQKSDEIAPIIVYPLRFFSLLFYPIVFVFSRVARLGARLVGGGKTEQNVFITREQMRMVVEMAERGASVDVFDRARIKRAIRFAEDCDLCIVLGSSLVVYPAAAIPARAVETGAELIIINRDPTPMDEKAHLVLHDSLSRALPEIMDLLTEIT